MEGLRGGGHGEAAVDGGDERWVEDSSVDYQGRPPLRAATGSWKAAMFIICKPL
jgi:peptide/histidine transporter 3/4